MSYIHPDAKRQQMREWHPCRICGWSEGRAIHQPALNSKDNKPWGHQFEPVEPKKVTP